MTTRLYYTRRTATEYLGCSPEELDKWVEPDKVLPSYGPTANPAMLGAKLWTKRTLDKAKPHIEGWRAAREEESARLHAESEAGRRRRIDELRRSYAAKHGHIPESRDFEAATWIVSDFKEALDEWRRRPDDAPWYTGGNFERYALECYIRGDLEAITDGLEDHGHNSAEVARFVAAIVELDDALAQEIDAYQQELDSD